MGKKQTTKERRDVEILDLIHCSLTKDLQEYVSEITLEEYCVKYPKVCFYANCFYFTRNKKQVTVTNPYMRRCKLSGFSAMHSNKISAQGYYYSTFDIRIFKRVFPQLTFYKNTDQHWYTEWVDSAEFLKWFPTRRNLIDEILADLD